MSHYIPIGSHLLMVHHHELPVFLRKLIDGHLRRSELPSLRQVKARIEGLIQHAIVSCSWLLWWREPLQVVTSFEVGEVKDYKFSTHSVEMRWIIRCGHHDIFWFCHDIGEELYISTYLICRYLMISPSKISHVHLARKRSRTPLGPADKQQKVQRFDRQGWRFDLGLDLKMVGLTIGFIGKLLTMNWLLSLSIG